MVVVDGAGIPESTSLKVFDIASQLDIHYFHKMVFLITLFKLTRPQEDGTHFSTWFSCHMTFDLCNFYDLFITPAVSVVFGLYQGTTLLLLL